MRFYDSESAVVWSRLERGRASVVPVTDISSESWSAELAEVKRLYQCKPPFVLLHVSAAEKRTKGIVIWAIRNAAGTALVHAISSLPPADTIAEVSVALAAKAIYLQSTHTLFKRRASIAFELPLLLQRRRTDAGSSVPAVFIRNTSGRRTMPSLFRTRRPQEDQ